MVLLGFDEFLDSLEVATAWMIFDGEGWRFVQVVMVESFELV